MKSLIKREMISGGDEAKAPPEVLPPEPPNDPEPQTPNDWDTPIEWDDEIMEKSPVEGVEEISERVKALEEGSRDVEKLWDAIESLKENQKELREGTMLAIDKLVDQAVMNLEFSKAFLEFSKRIVKRLESEETPEAPPEEEELEIAARLILEDEAMLDEITGRVLESLAKDIDAERDEVYKDILWQVRDCLSAIRVSDGEKHVRLFRMGQKLDDLTEKIEALTTEVPSPKKPYNVEVEARTGLAPSEETFEDILVVCAHGGKGLRTGFTADDRRENVSFCPRCGRRVTYT